MLRPNIMLLPAILALSACDQTALPYAAGPSYGYGQVAQQTYVHYGRIVGVRPVSMQRSANGDKIAGAVAGGLVGAVIGHQFGAGSGKDVMTGAGAIAGAMVGSKLATRTGTYMSQAWTVHLDDGDTVTIIQASNMFHVGQRVKIIERGSEMYLEP